MCFSFKLNKFFSLPSISCKFTISKWIIVGHKEPMTIVASSTTCLLILSHGWSFIQLIFDFIFVTNCVSIWFILLIIFFSVYLTPIPHAMGPHHSTFVNNIFHMQGIKFRKSSFIREIYAINQIKFF
jgi:hypothetical protein